MMRLSAPRLPRLHSPLDQDDLQILGRVLIYSLLVLWVVSLIALALGLGMRLFAFAAYGG